MTTTEKNIVIADFVGLRKVNCVLNENGRYFDYELNNNFELIKEQEIQIESNNGFGLVSQDYVFAEDLVFHSNWAWLMKVIEKIETSENRRFKVDIYDNMCSIIDTKENEEIFCFNCDAKINVTFESVFTFCNWYNEQKK